MAAPRDDLFKFKVDDKGIDRAAANATAKLNLIGTGLKKLQGITKKLGAGAGPLVGLGLGYAAGRGDQGGTYGHFQQPYSGAPQTAAGGLASNYAQFGLFKLLGMIPGVGKIAQVGAAAFGPALNHLFNGGISALGRKSHVWDDQLAQYTGGVNAHSIWDNVNKTYGITTGVKSWFKGQRDWADKVTGEKARYETELLKEYQKTITSNFRQ
jgi:hypothetical protein